MKHLPKNVVLLLFLFACGQGNKDKLKYIDNNRTTRGQILKFVADSLYEVNNYDGAMKYYDTLIILEPRIGEYYYKRAFSYDMVNKKAGARQSIADYLKSIEFGYKVSKSYYHLGLTYIAIKDSTALFYFKKSIETDPNNADAAIMIELLKKRMADRGIRLRPS